MHRPPWPESRLTLTTSVKLRRGVRVENAITLFHELEWNSRNEGVPVGSTNPTDQRDAYVRWATSTEQRLQSVLDRPAIEALFDSPRHRDICSMPAGNQLATLIHAELDIYCSRFGELAAELEAARGQFSASGVYVVPDTSFYVEHPSKFEVIDFRPLLAIREEPVRVVVPILVIDELDGLKRSSDKRARWRARYTLAVIDRVLPFPEGSGVLRSADWEPLNRGGIPSGEVSVQIVFDPPGHVREPINDDELIDRAVACQAFTGGVTMITYDTGQATRARLAGLRVVKLDHPAGDPPPGES